MAGPRWRVPGGASALRRAALVGAVTALAAATGCVSIESSIDIDTVATTDPLDGAAGRTPDGTPTTDRSTTVPTSTVPTSSVSTGTVPTPTTVPPRSTTSTAATTVAPTTAAGADLRPLALDVLARIEVASERPEGYSRDLFDHWITRNGCTTRETVLIRESLSYPQVDPVGCTVVAGDWLSVYDGATWTDPSDLDIDHVVALKEAWDSGAWAWTDAQRRAFANDLSDVRTLRDVTDNVNQSKSDADPSNWMPPLRTFWCTYLGDWVAIKARWGLSMDQSESGRIANLLRAECPGWRIDPFAAPPA